MRKHKFTTESLDDHGSVATDTLISNEFAWGNVEVDCDIFSGEIAGKIRTWASDQERYSAV